MLFHIDWRIMMAMGAMEHKNDSNPAVNELLQGVDPYVFCMLSDPAKAAAVGRLQREVIDADELLLGTEEGQHFTEAVKTVYSQEGHVIHLRRAPETGRLAAVLVNMEHGARQEFAQVECHQEAVPQYGVPAVRTLTRFVLSAPEEQPFLMEASTAPRDQAAEVATRAVRRLHEQASLTFGPRGWFYKPVGTTAQVPVHDWSNIAQQRELLRHRGLLLEADEADRTVWPQHDAPSVGISV